jgi:hypothetical protein
MPAYAVNVGHCDLLHSEVLLERQEHLLVFHSLALKFESLANSMQRFALLRQCCDVNIAVL